MTTYISGEITFEREPDDKLYDLLDEVFCENCEPCLENGNTLIINKVIINYHDSDITVDTLNDLMSRAELNGNKVVSGNIKYQGDYEGNYLFDKDEWKDYPVNSITDFSNEEIFAELSRRGTQIPIAVVREVLNERCVKEKTLGWTDKETGDPEVGCDYALGCTTDDDVATDKDVISYIQTEMFDDDENDSVKLLDLYRNANETERAIMDSVLVCICGWTMSHIAEESADWDGNEY